MAQTETRARKALKRVGVARGNLAFLSQPDRSQLQLILNRFASRYRVATTRASVDATPDDSAATLIKNLDGLMADASGIRGINRVEAELLNGHLQALASECQAFALSQHLNDVSSRNVADALDRFLGGDMGTGAFAGSALAPRTT
jgi:hypothetical protein